MHIKLRINLHCDKDKISEKTLGESSSVIALHYYSELEQAGSQMQVLSHIIKNYEQAPPTEEKKISRSFSGVHCWVETGKSLLGTSAFSNWIFKVIERGELPTDHNETQMALASTYSYITRLGITGYTHRTYLGSKVQLGQAVFSICPSLLLPEKCPGQLSPALRHTFPSFPMLQGRQHGRQYNTSGQIWESVHANSTEYQRFTLRLRDLSSVSFSEAILLFFQRWWVSL